MSIPGIVTTAQAAKELGVSTDTIRRWCENGTLKATWVGSLWAISEDAVTQTKRRRLIRQRHRAMLARQEAA